MHILNILESEGWIMQLWAHHVYPQINWLVDGFQINSFPLQVGFAVSLIMNDLNDM